MAEDTTTETGGEGAQAAQPSVDELMAQVKALTDERDKAVAESRKWEGRSKSNSEKAKKYDELAEVSEKYGVPASLLTERDRKAMERQAEAIKAFASGQPSAQVFRQDGRRPGKQAPDDMREYVKNLIH